MKRRDVLYLDREAVIPTVYVGLGVGVLFPMSGTWGLIASLVLLCYGVIRAELSNERLSHRVDELERRLRDEAPRP